MAPAAYATLCSGSAPSVSVRIVFVGVLGVKGQATESCKSHMGIGLEVIQSWRLEKPSTSCERIGGGMLKLKSSHLDPYVLEQTLLFSESATLTRCVFFNNSEKIKSQ